jgi:branched-chain amino acid aminotransferase
MDEMIGQYYIYNNAVKPIESVDADIDACTNSLYEVIRVIDRTPLFFEDHVARLGRSTKLAGRRFTITMTEIRRLAALLVEENDISSGNFKMVYRDNPDPSKEILLIYFIKSRCPDKTMYRDGITVGLLAGERSDPAIKRGNSPARKAADEVLKEGAFYEMLLVNADGYVTEGSRSNVFFIADDALHTPPDGDVLSGVTRYKVIEISAREGIKLLRRRISKNELGTFEAVFLTGTSLKVIAIRSVNGVSFRTDHPLLRSLMHWYDRCIEAYIKNDKNPTLPAAHRYR